VRRRAVLRFDVPDELSKWRRMLAALIGLFRVARELDPNASLRVEPDDD